METNEFYLPIIDKVTIYDYSLYKCPFEINFSSKLNIIYGTNGIGKSTLLMMVLFSIIGPYKDSVKTQIRKDRKEKIDRRYDSRRLYDESFFYDRMNEPLDSARIVSEFHINKDVYKVTHSLVDCSLSEVLVNGKALSGKLGRYKDFETKFFRKEDSYEEYLINNYQISLSKSTKLPDGINTLINMIQSIMLFNEGRKLTFWDADLQEMILGKYIVDAKYYEKFCEQKLSTKALESKYKKASETHNYMKQFFEAEKKRLAKMAKDTSNIDLKIELSEINSEIEKLTEQLAELRDSYSKKNADLMSFVRREELQKEELTRLEEVWYANLFPPQYNAFYKRFSNKMTEGVCPICGEKHSFELKTEFCIMCHEKLHLEKDINLNEIDIKRQDAVRGLEILRNKIKQLKSELELNTKRINSIKKELLEKKERQNKIQILLNPETESALDEQRLQYAIQERDNAAKNLAESRKKESVMRKKIEESLVDGFSLFQKIFKKYAIAFFGDDNDIEVSLPFSDDAFEDDSEESPLKNMLIQFKLNDKYRSDSDMLSESQRIFTDFAFRLTVLTAFHKDSFFVCETPDSTLDMFHEKNAVETFKNYIKQGNSLIITANARKSNLIKQLYYSFDKKDVNVIDLTKKSNLALPNKYDFESFIKEN